MGAEDYLTEERNIMALRTAKTTDLDAKTNTAAEADLDAQAREAASTTDVVSEQGPVDEAVTIVQDAAKEETTLVHETVVADEPIDEGTVVQPAEQQVAVVTGSTGVAASGNQGVKGAMVQFKEDLASEGYEGITIDGMSFDRVKLHEALFKLGSDEVSLGNQIDVLVLSTRNIYIVRQYAGEGAEVFYSYDADGSTKADGTSSADILDKWKEDGYGTEDSPLDIKKYIEATAQLVNRDDEYAEQIVILSIPPASCSRLGGAMAVGKQRLKVGPSNLVIRCKVGNKIGSGQEAFRPWVFTAHSVYQ